MAEVRHYRDALVVWARDAVSSVFALRDRPEMADELARFTLRMASGTAVARWFEPDTVLEKARRTAASAAGMTLTFVSEPLSARHVGVPGLGCCEA